jgi:hypothetical protein
LDPVLVEPTTGDGVAAVQAGLKIEVNNVGR